MHKEIWLFCPQYLKFPEKENLIELNYFLASGFGAKTLLVLQD
jgi:hypothetical protein